MNRRTFVTGLGAMLAAPFVAEAQQAGRVPRVGVLLLGPPSAPITLGAKEALRQGLKEHGDYVEGRNIAIEYRYGDVDGLSSAANDLVRLNVDLIVAGGTAAAIAAKRATNTIPIVAGVMADPVADGLVASLAAPGGNLTGNTFLAPVFLGLIPVTVTAQEKMGDSRVQVTTKLEVIRLDDVEGLRPQ
jgi:ABC-type uncharacterized transport system substrate-binding protein